LSRRKKLPFVGALCALLITPAAHAAPALDINVVSNRADLISAGDALVAVQVPQGVSASSIRVTDDGRDVTSAFAQRADGRFAGVVTGLDVGANKLTASAPGAKSDAVTIRNHPNGGPVFSGPQIQPWVCQATARDAQCNEPAQYDYRYKSSSGSFQPYDPESPPSDVATTTTDEGNEVPYIVRVETGYQARDQYKIAVLYDPTKPWAPWAPQDGWNRKLLITHGASCGIERQAGAAPDVMNDEALSRGFAVMSTALNNSGHNCNVVTQAESMVMAKERLVEQYGEIRYTIGTGGSGGALAQHQVANAYPGIYQGILPAASFPDAWSTAQQLSDYSLIRRYVEDPARWAPGVVWTPREIAAVEGHPNHVNSIVFDTAYWTSLGVVDDGCPGVPAEQNYNQETNPGGVRCGLADYMINVFGPRPAEMWGPQEKQIGRGFAGLAVSNRGVQYGLEALERGEISVQQFVDLNAKLGGVDIDIKPTEERRTADQPALRRSYLSGAVNDGTHLDKVAIIDLRGPDHGVFHDAYRSWAVRARIEREHGHFRNHVIWVGHVPLAGDPNHFRDAFLAMDRWLAAVEKDGSSKPLADKIVANRPADIQDRCSQVPAVEAIELPGIGRVCEQEHVQSRYGTPRTVAGEGVVTDNNECVLKPLRRTDYYPVAFTDAQWAALQQVFPDGVCDWSRQGIDQPLDTVAWQTYQDAAGRVTYGGRALGTAPAGSGDGWSSPSFGAWRQSSVAPK
jgi:Tannase-like family of unknown function (DUF6351)